jgi:hypothetical protein
MSRDPARCGSHGDHALADTGGQYENVTVYHPDSAGQYTRMVLVTTTRTQLEKRWQELGNPLVVVVPSQPPAVLTWHGDGLSDIESVKLFDNVQLFDNLQAHQRLYHQRLYHLAPQQ